MRLVLSLCIFCSAPFAPPIFAWPADKVSHASVDLSMSRTTFVQVVKFGLAIDTASGSLLQIPAASYTGQIPAGSNCRATAVKKVPIPTLENDQCLFAWMTAAHCVDWAFDQRVTDKKVKVGDFFVSNNGNSIVFRSPAWEENIGRGFGDVAVLFFNKTCSAIPDSQVFPIGQSVSKDEAKESLQLEIHGTSGVSLFQTTEVCQFSDLDNSERVCADRVWSSTPTFPMIPGNSGSTLHDPHTAEIRGVLSLSSYQKDGNEGNHVGFSSGGLTWAKEKIDQFVRLRTGMLKKSIESSAGIPGSNNETLTHRDLPPVSEPNNGVAIRVEGNMKVVYVNGRAVAKVAAKQEYVEPARAKR